MFRGLEKRWYKCILSGGDYFKGDETDLEVYIKIVILQSNSPYSLWAKSTVE